MGPLVRRYLRTAIAFLILGLLLGVWMLVQREVGGSYPAPRVVSAHTHVILVGFVMMMILGVALWMFPRPERDDPRYRPAVAEVAYWLVTVSTAVRFVGEVTSPPAPGPLVGWVIVAAGLGQVAGLIAFFYNLLPRIRTTRKED
ncbi:MAG TPA: cbb3-type cytochrome c oxidase subunit I [Gemmatimonadales bacterium]|nr:cbb3-type cytochrome c oxidase subunit I [Gemmatimonadales bacterium]